MHRNFYSSYIPKHFTKLNLLITQIVNTIPKLNNLAGRRREDFRGRYKRGWRDTADKTDPKPGSSN